jgi:excinuclease ABC subunit C
LDDIPSVGSVTRHKLMAHFKTILAIRQASEDELLEVVNLKVAKNILKFFKASDS